MAFTLKIRFHGIIGYVESLDEDKKQVSLLLCKAGRRLVPDQEAYVRFPKDAYDFGSNRPCAPVVPDAPKDLRHVVLKCEWLSIEVPQLVDGDRTLKLDKKTDPLGSPTPTSVDRNSLVWVPDMDKLSHGYGKVKSAYFEKPKKAHPRLIARVDLTQGRLGTTGFDQVQVPFNTDPPSGNASRRMAISRELLLTFRTEANHFILRSRTLLGGPHPKRNLRFKLEKDLEIVIGNEAAADIYKTALSIQPIDALESQCMAEFKFYHRMCETYPEAPLIPYLSSRPGTDTCCSVTRFRPSDIVLSTPDRPRTTKAIAKEKPAWVMLAYLAADNSLSAIADDDVDKFEKPHDHGVGVVIQLDRFDRPTRRLMLDDEEGLVPTPVQPCGNLNSGDPKVLTEFLVYGKNLYGKASPKAPNTAVFLLSHGAGLLDFTHPHAKPKVKKSWLDRQLARGRRLQIRAWNGLVAIVLSSLLIGKIRRVLRNEISIASVNPDLSAGDYLDNQELAKGLSDALKGSEKFGIIGFDACVMALVEMAYELRNYGEYLVASQDDIRVEGCPYDSILSKVGKNLPADVAKMIVEEYGKTTARDPLATLSAVELCKIRPLVDALDVLGSQLLVVLPKRMKAIAKARNAARAFANFHYIDLHEFVEGILERFETVPAIADPARAVLAAIKAAVIATSKDPLESHAYGISVYLPNSKVAPVYAKLAWYLKGSSWCAFVEAYAQAPRNA